MTEKLKYKVGDKVLVEVEIASIDGSDDTPYCLNLFHWMSEEGLEQRVVHLPPKPKIPQAVMDWYFKYQKRHWDVDSYLTESVESGEAYSWLFTGNRQLSLDRQHALATLIAYGPEAVEVEKEKEYRVFIKGTSVYGNRQKLHYKNGNVLFVAEDILDSQDMFSKQKLDDIGFEGVFNNPMFEVEEVE